MSEERTQEFAGKVMGDVSSTTTTLLAALGDRLGLWKDLAARGNATSAELAARMQLSERHVREWLGAMASAGYLDYDPASRRFALPAEHQPILSQEAGPMFFGGGYEILLGCLQPFERIIDTFRTGGGVPQSAYPDRTFDGMERFSAGWYEHFLIPVWLKQAGLIERLQSGIDVADVGCGRGRAIVKLAQEFPRSRFVGYDVYGPNVARARARAVAAGVQDRVQFVEADATAGMHDRFDLITTFDVVHDATDPQGLLRSIRRALKPEGTYLCLDINCSHRLEENRGPMGAFFHGISTLYCMTTSLAYDGAALGTCGLHPHKLAELAAGAGFSTVEKLAIDNPFNNLYALRTI